MIDNERCTSILTLNKDVKKYEITIQCQLDHDHQDNHKFYVLDDQGKIYQVIEW